MSTMRADLLQNRLGTSHPAVMRADFVKAWVSVNNSGATAAIYLSFNIASVTDGGVGVHTPNFTASFANVSYVSSASSSNDAANYCYCSPYNPPNSYVSGRTMTTAKAATTGNGTATDGFAVYASYFGDLA